MLSKNLLQELDQIVREDYKKELSHNETIEVAEKLVNYFDLLAKIQLTSQEYGDKNEK